MNSIFKYLAIVAALSTATVVVAAPAKPAPERDFTPQVFNDLGVTMQSRVCGELMASLALGGVQAALAQFPTAPVPAAQRQPVYDTSAKAVVLLMMSGSLKLEDRLKAGEVAQVIEKMDPSVHVYTAMFCQRRVEAWIRAGHVTKDAVDQANTQAKVLMDTAFNTNGAGNVGR